MSAHESLSEQFDSLRKVGIDTTAPKNWPTEGRPSFKEDYSEAVGRGTTPLDLQNTKFFSNTQTDLNPRTVDAYRKARSERKSDVWGDEEDPEYEHLEYPQVYMHEGMAEIIDGHHRIAAALADKRPSIDAYVFTPPTKRSKNG
jgi:hypothetical protein